MKNVSKGKNGFTVVSNSLIIEMVPKVGLDTACFYIVLKSHKIAKDAHCCYPSLKLLATECNCSIRTVSRHLKTLEDNGYIITNSGSDGQNNNYYFPKEEWHKEEDLKGVSKRKGKIKKLKNKESDKYVNGNL